MKKRLISLCLVITTLLSISALPAYSLSTNEDSQRPHRTNFQIINNDLKNLEYTYDEDGKSFLIKECLSDDFSETITETYFFDSSLSDYVLLSKTITYVTFMDNGMNYSVYENGQLIDNGNLTYHTTTSIERIDNPYALQSSNQDFIWKYVYKTENDTVIARYVLSFVITTLASMIFGVSSIDPNIATGLTGVASMIVADMIPAVYGEHYTYFGYVRETSVLPAMERRSSYFFRDAAHKQFIERAVIEGYYPIV